MEVFNELCSKIHCLSYQAFSTFFLFLKIFIILCVKIELTAQSLTSNLSMATTQLILN